jgi:hypothetical protein
MAKYLIKWMGGRMRKELGMVTFDIRQKMGIVKTRGTNGEQRLMKLLKD